MSNAPKIPEILSSIQFRFLIQRVRLEDGSQMIVKQLQYAPFFIDPETKQSQIEADWINVPEVVEGMEEEEIGSSNTDLDAETEAELDRILGTDDLPSFLRPQAD